MRPELTITPSDLSKTYNEKASKVPPKHPPHFGNEVHLRPDVYFSSGQETASTLREDMDRAEETGARAMASARNANRSNLIEVHSAARTALDASETLYHRMRKPWMVGIEDSKKVGKTGQAMAGAQAAMAAVSSIVIDDILDQYATLAAGGRLLSGIRYSIPDGPFGDTFPAVTEPAKFIDKTLKLDPDGRLFALGQDAPAFTSNLQHGGVSRKECMFKYVLLTENGGFQLIFSPNRSQVQPTDAAPWQHQWSHGWTALTYDPQKKSLSLGALCRYSTYQNQTRFQTSDRELLTLAKNLRRSIIQTADTQQAAFAF